MLPSAFYCQPSNPLQLWITHHEALIEDFARNNDLRVVVNQSLHDIDRVLHENSSSCLVIGLPLPQGDFNDEQPLPFELAPSFDELTDEQLQLAERVLQSVSPGIVQEESVANLHCVDAQEDQGRHMSSTSCLYISNIMA